MLFASVSTTLGWVVALVVGLVAAFGLAILPHNLRVRRVRRVYQQLPADVRRRVLCQIAEYAAGGPAVTLLRADSETPYDDNAVRIASHAGGAPYAEAGNMWPIEEGDDSPARFLIQVLLRDPSLPPVWQGRLVQVFLQYSDQQITRSFAAPRAENYAPLAPVGPMSRGVVLEELSYPAEPGEEGEPDERLPVSARRLVERIPALADTLRPYTSDAAGVVAQIISPGIYGYEIDGPWTAYVGGSPYLIQNPHDLLCPNCRQPLRFLFFFGEVIPEVQLADGGCCCVYGCDEHPGCVQAVIDSH